LLFGGPQKIFSVPATLKEKKNSKHTEKRKGEDVYEGEFLKASVEKFLSSFF